MEDNDRKSGDRQPYVRLLIALAISYVVMFVSGYAMVDSWDHVYLNLSRVYMTSLMVAPMAVIMLVVMSSMYKNRAMNIGIGVASVVLTVLFWALLRMQAGIGESEFFRSMIPHHSAAVLVCENASLDDPETVALCQEIIETQEEEIRIMKEMMARRR